MKLRLVGILGLLTCLVGTSTAQAGFRYTFDNVQDITINSSNTIRVFLMWDGTGTNNLAAPGLISAFTGLRYNSTAGATISVANPTGVMFNFQGPAGPSGQGFDDQTVHSPAQFTTPPTYSHQTNLIAVLPGTSANPPATTAQNSSLSNGGAADRLYIGSFVIQAGPLPGVISLRADRRNLTGTGNILDANFVSLDSMVNPLPTDGVTTFAINIPEPASMILVGLAATGFGGYIVRRRKLAKTDASKDVAG